MLDVTALASRGELPGGIALVVSLIYLAGQRAEAWCLGPVPDLDTALFSSDWSATPRDGLGDFEELPVHGDR